MKETPSKNFNHLLHPYLFVLKEGKEIQQNFLDYSLLLLQVEPRDVIPSPFQSKISNPIVTLLKK
jgi:hypothetical protein